MPLLLANRWSCGNSIFTRCQENESPASSYSSTLGRTNHTKGPKRAPVWTIAIIEPQSSLVENRPAVSTGVGQASRRPACPFRQPCLPGIAWIACIAIGSLATAVDWFVSFTLHEPITCSYNCVIEKGFSEGEKKDFPILTVLVPISQKVTEYVFCIINQLEKC